MNECGFKCLALVWDDDVVVGGAVGFYYFRIYLAQCPVQESLAWYG